jgi:hypothetical protein
MRIGTNLSWHHRCPLNLGQPKSRDVHCRPPPSLHRTLTDGCGRGRVCLLLLPLLRTGGDRRRPTGSEVRRRMCLWLFGSGKDGDDDAHGFFLGMLLRMPTICYPCSSKSLSLSLPHSLTIHPIIMCILFSPTNNPVSLSSGRMLPPN